MATGYPKIPTPKDTVPTTFGGDVMNTHQDINLGVDVAASDPLKKRSIGTETSYKDNKLAIWMTNLTNKIRFRSPNMPNDVAVSFPTNMDNVDPNEFLFREVPAEIEGKVIDGTKNSVINVVDSIAKQILLINEGTEPVATTSPSSGRVPIYRKDIDVNNQAVYISKMEGGVAVKVRVA